VLGAFPIRSRLASDFEGRYAAKGSKDDQDWQGFVPYSLVPQLMDPRSDVLFSANHRPAGSFYKIPLGLSTGSMGDTVRSWRLREILTRPGSFTPQQVLDVHYDTVNPARRNMVRIALHMRDSNQDGLSDDCLQALVVLEKWLQEGASSDLRNPGAQLATQLSTFFRVVSTPLAAKYGGGESGLARFLKDATSRIAADPKAVLDEDERRFIDNILAAAWKGTGGPREPNPRQPTRPAAQRPQMLGWFDSLDGFGSLNPDQDLVSAPITCLDGQTIHCQSSQSYTQFVPLHDADSAQTICPIGHSDRPDSSFRTSTMNLWGEAKLHAAPLSRSAVEKIADSTLTLAK
jgi:acyl-homoserine lactone acylase PvdQ